MNLYVGTSGYSYKEWKGSFYPEKLAAKQMLRYYGEHFRAVEINSTFYALPRPSVLEAWIDEVPDDFRFVLKAPQLITHRLRLKNAEDPLRQLLDISKVLKKRSGPLLFQLPPNLKKDLPRLCDFLSLLPADCRAAFEFRHQSWFEEDVFDALHNRRVALCIAEAENDLKIPFVSTADWGYLRLRGKDYTTAELKKWVGKSYEQKWSDLYVFFKHEDSGTGPRLAKKFLELAK